MWVWSAGCRPGQKYKLKAVRLCVGFIAVRSDEDMGEMKAVGRREGKQRLTPEPCLVTVNKISGDELEGGKLAELWAGGCQRKHNSVSV